MQLFPRGKPLTSWTVRSASHGLERPRPGTSPPPDPPLLMMAMVDIGRRDREGGRYCVGPSSFFFRLVPPTPFSFSLLRLPPPVVLCPLAFLLSVFLFLFVAVTGAFRSLRPLSSQRDSRWLAGDVVDHALLSPCYLHRVEALPFCAFIALLEDGFFFFFVLSVLSARSESPPYATVVGVSVYSFFLSSVPQPCCSAGRAAAARGCWPEVAEAQGEDNQAQPYVCFPQPREGSMAVFSAVRLGLSGLTRPGRFQRRETLRGGPSSRASMAWLPR